jgi:hypothetical protein
MIIDLESKENVNKIMDVLYEYFDNVRYAEEKVESASYDIAAVLNKVIENENV